jgi:hypothetical protein
MQVLCSHCTHKVLGEWVFQQWEGPPQAEVEVEVMTKAKAGEGD